MADSHAQVSAPQDAVQNSGRYETAEPEPAGSPVLAQMSATAGSLVRLFFSRKGRLSRGHFWLAAFAAWALFWFAFALLDGESAIDLTRIPAALLIASLFCLMSKRYHDLDRSSLWLLLMLVPVFGLLVVIFELGFRRGSMGENGYGTDPRDLRALTRDYATVS